MDYQESADRINDFVQHEGWALFSGDEGLRIEKYDGCNRFTGDEEVWRHVVRLASGGSEIHRQTLAVVKGENPIEYARLKAFADRKGLRDPDTLLPVRYSHVLTLAFTVESYLEDGSDLTPDRIYDAVKKRISDLNSSDGGTASEWLEACLPPHDTDPILG